MELLKRTMLNFTSIMASPLLAIRTSRKSLRLLQNDFPPLRQEFHKCQLVFKPAADKASEDWILKVANEAESAISNLYKGNVQWECMKRLQVAYHGHKPLQVNTIVDENGNILSNHSDVCARWQHHFLNVLNVPSNFQEDVMNSVLQLPVRGPS